MTSGFGEGSAPRMRATRRLAPLRLDATGLSDAPPVDRSAIPAADLALLVDAIDRRRASGLCGRHQHRSQSGCDAVVVWPRDEAAAAGRPSALFCRDRHGGYSVFAGNGSLMAAGSIADVIRWWK